MKILDVVLIVNITLKLAGVISWSWWAVLWPIWFIVILLILADLGG